MKAYEKVSQGRCEYLTGSLSIWPDASVWGDWQQEEVGVSPAYNMNSWLCSNTAGKENESNGTATWVTSGHHNLLKDYQHVPGHRGFLFDTYHFPFLLNSFHYTQISISSIHNMECFSDE